MQLTRWLISSSLIVVMVMASLISVSRSIQADGSSGDFDSLAAGAESIIVGNVESRTSQWNEEHTRIYSSVKIQVDFSLKGRTEDFINLNVPGGEVGGITQTVSDSPSFSKEERVVVFLTNLKDNTYEIYGFNKGKITLGKDIDETNISLSSLKTQIEKSDISGSTASTAGAWASVAAGPTVTAINPGSASAGTNSIITVTGSGFGTNAGSVNFFFCYGESTIVGSIVSWSDTSIAVKVPVGTVSGYPASASSGWIYVKSYAGVQSDYFPFSVTFSYGGIKWPGTSPVINYYVNPNTADTTGEENGVKAAANTWSGVSGSAFTFNYAGATGATGYGFNSRNEVMWVNLGSGGIIARACYWYSGSTLVETDIEFNEYFAWSVASSTPSGYMDVESIALHELGHWLSLRDLYGNLSGYPADAAKIMYGFGSTGVSRRILSSADQDGIRYIYPSAEIPALKVTAPNGGEEWQAGTTQTIAWTYSGSPGSYVNIQLYKGGSLKQSVVLNTSVGSSGSGSYTWGLPSTLENGSDYNIKITSLTNSDCFDYSNSYFGISAAPTPSITLTSPNGGETWQAGSGQTIAWSYSGDPGPYVRLQLYESGVLVNTITTSTALGSSGQGTYAWTIPSNRTVDSTYSIKVASTQNSTYCDSSDSYFSISAAASAALKVTAPDGGETWKAGTTQNITWTYSGDAGSNVKIQLYQGETLDSTVAASISIGSGGQGSYAWTIPAAKTADSNYSILVTSTSNAGCFDSSDSCFTIAAAGLPGITVTAPNGGETWKAGTAHIITWTYTGSVGSYVKIQLYQSETLKSTVVSSTSAGSAGQGYYIWNIPLTTAAGSEYSILVTSTSNTECFDHSASYFQLSAAELPAITVAAPDGGETWQAGTAHTISWDYSGSPGSTVKIQLFQAGKLNSTIASSTSTGSGGKGTYAWTVPATKAAGSNYAVKITSNQNSAYTDTSNSYFSLSAAAKPSITVVTPDGGETWQAGTTQNITWSYTANPGAKVRIQLYKGSTLSGNIATSTSIGSGGQGSYAWTIPAKTAAGSNYSIKITSTVNSAYYDISDVKFIISAAVKPTISIIAPDGGETWKAGMIQTISWSYTGNPGSKVIVLLYNKGVLVRTIVNSVSIGSDGSGFYSWTVPFAIPIGSNYKIRVKSTTNSTYYDESNNYLTITLS